ncbi:MAG TPA: hypothetical protein PLB35_08225 [Myxococcota bacterium]|nr:hypothetical protein [Myxococcota bacterium]HOA13970.1 hypothetical protein [Myxococcota bacterium]HOH77227.1 hypothetical protein [Myxococcota bacterium]HPV05242.1 hypothetical protein [Myxococcota bacterium]
MRIAIQSTVVVALAIMFSSSAFAGTWEITNQIQGGFIFMLEVPDETHAFGFGSIPDPADPQNDKFTGFKMNPNGTWGEFMPPASGDMLVPMNMQCTAPDNCLMLATDINTQTMAMKTPLMLSKDGGNKWTTFTDPFFKRPSAPSNFNAFGTKLVWFYGTDTIVLISKNGGGDAKSWFVPTIGDVKFMSIQGGFILNDNVGFLMNQSMTESEDKKTRTVNPVGALMKTSDLQVADPKDMTWEILFQDQTVYARKLHFVNENVGYMITDDGTNYGLSRTTDGGRNWTPIVFPQVGELAPIQWVNDIAVFDEDNLFVVAGIPNGEEDSFGVIFRISDGVTPVPVLPDPTEHQMTMQVIRCVTPYYCLAAGEEATVLRFTDEPPVVVEEDSDIAIVSDGADRDAFAGDDQGGQIEDVEEGIDLKGWTPPKKDSGCSTGNGPGTGPAGLALLILGCALCLAWRRRQA